MFFNQRKIDQLITIITDAGGIIEHNYAGEADFSYKDDCTIVTKTDIQIHQFLMTQLSVITPGTPTISEESPYIAFKDRRHWQEYWLVDPLDGTRGFVDKTDDFCICIAYIQNHKSVFGMIYIPMKRTCYYANSDNTAYKLKNGKLKQITASNPQMPLRVLTGRYSLSQKSITQHLKYATKNGRYKINGVGSAIKFCLIAEGKFDYYPALGICSEWDTAAGSCLLKAAGGYVVDQDGNELNYNTKNDFLSPIFFASGKKIFSREE